jgi:hypothetical protein
MQCQLIENQSTLFMFIISWCIFCDYPQAIEFYAREMKNYKDLVKSNKNDYSLSDRITLWFNNWTNTSNFSNFHKVFPNNISVF